jgi:hypothetical protein
MLLNVAVAGITVGPKVCSRCRQAQCPLVTGDGAKYSDRQVNNSFNTKTGTFLQFMRTILYIVPTFQCYNLAIFRDIMPKFL